MCCTTDRRAFKIFKGDPLITNNAWTVRLRNKKRNFIMSLFRKNKELEELRTKVINTEWKIDSLIAENNRRISDIKKIKLISNIFPHEELHPMMDDYKKDRERLEKEGYTMQGCADHYEIWVNKGVKNG